MQMGKLAYIFPGQGSQFPGMAADLYSSNPDLFESANRILGFRISDLMFNGSEEDLRRTDVTQPAVFLHSLAMASGMRKPDMVAGHSLGEFSALTVAEVLNFEDALKLVRARAEAMQECCRKAEGTMAAIIGPDAGTVEKACEGSGVIAANYNCPTQTVISGAASGVAELCDRFRESGAIVCPLNVGGAFHTPLMGAASGKLAEAIEATEFKAPVCPVYQNVDASAETDPGRIKEKLLAQMTSPVRWSDTILRMRADGAEEFVEVGPGKTLTKLNKRIL